MVAPLGEVEGLQPSVTKVEPVRFEPKLPGVLGSTAPGLTVAADALYQATAKLPRVEIARPPSVIGRNTVASMQAGLVFGYAGLVDALVERIRGEIDFSPRVVGTGGLATLIATEARTIDECDDMLTLQGLAILYDRNHPDPR